MRMVTGTCGHMGIYGYMGIWAWKTIAGMRPIWAFWEGYGMLWHEFATGNEWYITVLHKPYRQPGGQAGKLRSCTRFK
jgi:hypothetical protein